jgi:hypothetical protein
MPDRRRADEKDFGRAALRTERAVADGVDELAGAGGDFCWRSVESAPVETFVDDPVTRPELILRYAGPAFRAREAQRIL